MNKRNSLTLLGFALFTLAAVELVLELVGLRLGILAFLSVLGPIFAFFVKLLMLFGGIVLVVLALDKEDNYDEFFDGKGKDRQS